MTRERHSKRVAYTWIVMGLIVIGVVALTGSGRREPVRAPRRSSAAATPSAEVTAGVARADVDTCDLQLD